MDKESIAGCIGQRHFALPRRRRYMRWRDNDVTMVKVKETKFDYVGVTVLLVVVGLVVWTTRILLHPVQTHTPLTNKALVTG